MSAIRKIEVLNLLKVLSVGHRLADPPTHALPFSLFFSPPPWFRTTTQQANAELDGGDPLVVDYVGSCKSTRPRSANFPTMIPAAAQIL
jgi:hypothetical protein